MKNLRGSIMLLIAALIWGTTFVAQSEGAQIVEPFTYNSLRMYIGSIVLIPVILIFNKTGAARTMPKQERIAKIKRTVIGGICCGAVLFTASSLQQFAMKTTSAGKAGFITTLYIVIVPLIELLLLRRKTSKQIWLCVLLAVTGFYLLCIKEGFTITRGDFLVLLSAFFFACHIIVIDRFTAKDTDSVMMACVQFFVSGTLALVMMFIFESPRLAAILEAKYAILYAGLLSSGVAYTLQIIGQRRTDPTIATLLMSLESVFAAVSGAIILHESLTIKEKIGCMLVFAAVIIAQLGAPDKSD